MSLLKTVLAASVLALGLFVVPAAQAKALETRYASVSIANPTNLTLAYGFRWGTTGEFKVVKLEPGKVMTHTWRLAPGEDSCPQPQIRFFPDLTNLDSTAVKNLQAVGAPDDSVEASRVYEFVLRGARLSLVAIN
jgi:hypothetical protein